MKNKKLLVISFVVLAVICLCIGLVLAKNNTKRDGNKETSSVEETEKSADESEIDKNNSDEMTENASKTEILEDDSQDKGVVITAPSSWDDGESSETKQENTNSEGSEEAPKDEVEYGTIF